MKGNNLAEQNQLPDGILKIKKMLALGHIPCRKNEHYKAYHKHTGVEVYKVTNCLIHACFNLTNKQLQKLTQEDINIIVHHIEHKLQPTEEIKEHIFTMLNKAGLTVQKYKKFGKPLKENQWLVAFYVGKKYFYEQVTFLDYHFMLKEKDGTWSEKIGFTNIVNFRKAPPRSFTNKNTYIKYKREGIYVITNPYATAEKTSSNIEQTI